MSGLELLIKRSMKLRLNRFTSAFMEATSLSLVCPTTDWKKVVLQNLALCLDFLLCNERVPTFKFILHLDIAATVLPANSLSGGGETWVEVEPVTISFVLYCNVT